MSRIWKFSTWVIVIHNFNEDASEKMKVSNAITELLDGKELKILDIFRSLEKPRLHLGTSE